MITPEQTTELARQLEPVYGELAELVVRDGLYAVPETVHDQQFCATWSRLALRVARYALRFNNMISVEHIACNTSMNPGIYTAITPTYHEYLVAKSPGIDDPLVVDGTWQQYSPLARQQRSHLPRIMIAWASETPALLHQARIPARDHFRWRPDSDTHGIFDSIVPPPTGARPGRPLRPKPK